MRHQRNDRPSGYTIATPRRMESEMQTDERDERQAAELPDGDAADEADAETQPEDDATLHEMDEGDVERLSGEASPASPLAHP